MNTVEEKATIAKALVAHVWPLLESRRIKIVIFRIFPWSEVAEAHRMMERSDHKGKILLSFEQVIRSV
jgi:NADPH:quinone reductase